MTKARIIADYAGTGASTDLATQTELDAAETALGFQSVPHIIPGVLYPAVAGKDLSGTALGGSYTYGTAHTDGRSYYYTDIKGSKPIKDPRIGGHFGSQRHKFKSLQLLEQETATHGENVYSVDGREWVRVGPNWEIYNNDDGNFLFQTTSTTSFIEITGYFNDINFINKTETSRFDDVDITVNGAVGHTGNTTIAGRATVGSPLGARYVDSGSVINGGSTLSTALGTVPAINTIKLIPTNVSSEKWYLYGIELIAQDTTSTANKSKIQIPSQNVVSYGKKFTVSGTPHYDPFNGFTSGNLAAVQALIDTDTSLGMANWLSSSTYYRPFNGGRVVKWVDSSGNIKTSVTMMPPNAQNINGTESNPHTLGDANNDTINFNTSAIDHSLSEVAKTFFAQEFGNGNANGGSSGTYKDMTMLNGSDQKASFVMDDGLTSLCGDGLEYWGTGGSGGNQVAQESTSGDFNNTTFIGTGVSVVGYSDDSTRRSETIALNLPYSTHAFKQQRTGNNHPDLTLNGVSITKSGFDTKGSLLEITFHQPKKPPIPEDAVVLADYMLMADFVPIASAGIQNISKGVRSISCSRDMFWDETDDATVTLNISVGASASGFDMTWSNAADSAGTETVKLPTFSTNTVMRGYGGTDRFTLIGPATEAGAGSSADATGQYIKYTNNYTLGTNVVGASVKASKWLSVFNMEVVTPIHTSSHYQTFETPYLHELVGGDRNMEQNNLIVTPDGKSWDEVTRDTSYLSSNFKANIHRDGGSYTNESVWVWDVFRGKPQYSAGCVLKDFVPAYDRLVCLVDGKYRFNFQGAERAAGDDAYWYFQITGNAQIGVVAKPDGTGTRQAAMPGEQTFEFKRGDWIKIIGYYISGDDIRENTFTINKVD